MKNNPSIRALLFLALALSLFSFDPLSFSDRQLSPSPEKGFVSYSPAGEEGGAIIPASCESGYDDTVGAYTYGQYGSCQIIPNLWVSAATIPYGGYFNWGYNASPLGMMIGFGSNRRYTAYCNVYINGGLAWAGAPTAYTWNNWGPNYGTINVGVQCFNSPYNYPGPYQQANVYVSPPNSCWPAGDPPGYGGACNSTPNACGEVTGGGTIQCSGACSATPPPTPSNYGYACTGPANSCGLRSFGSIGCNNDCSAQFPPPESQCQELNTTAGTTTGTTLTATPQTTGLNGYSNLFWQSGESSCALYNAASGNVLATSTSGTLRVGPVSSVQRYILTCGNMSVSVTVRPNISFQEF